MRGKDTFKNVFMIYTETMRIQNHPEPASIALGTTIESSQDLNSSAYLGAPASEKTLPLRWKYYPEASLMHTGGNCGSSDNSGPLGFHPNVSSSTNTINIMLWGHDGSLTCGYANASAGNPPPRGLVALDPTTLDVLAAWYPPVYGTIGFAYMEYIEKSNDILLSTKEGQVYVVHREDCQGTPQFSTIRTLDLANVLQTGEKLLNSGYDTAGNIWFSSGAIEGAGDMQQNSTTYGYVTPEGKVVAKHVDNEMVENGIAITGMDVYMSTGPSGAADKPNATGYLYSMTSDGHGGIEIRWRVPYDAGSGMGNGVTTVTARGSGSTPALLNDQYIAITDKADSRIHLNVYHQEAKGSDGQQLVCQVPLFSPGKSNNDNAIIAHFDGTTYGMMVQNDYNSPVLYGVGATGDVNGDWNNMSIMAGGMVRVDIDAQGQCSVRWESDLAVKAVSILSTKTGLVYNYVQDIQRSQEGEYIWYVAGVDWETGETLFKIRTGSGGIFNDNWGMGTVSPDGSFFQAVLGGVVVVKDGI